MDHAGLCNHCLPVAAAVQMLSAAGIYRSIENAAASCPPIGGHRIFPANSAVRGIARRLKLAKNRYCSGDLAAPSTSSLPLLEIGLPRRDEIPAEY